VTELKNNQIYKLQTMRTFVDMVESLEHAWKYKLQISSYSNYSYGSEAERQSRVQSFEMRVL
jgi:hypothetical protein